MELRANIPSGPIEQKWDNHRFEMKLVNPANKRRFQIIVVGSGLAGAAAANARIGLQPTLGVGSRYDCAVSAFRS